jgi:hypothetical protein
VEVNTYRRVLSEIREKFGWPDPDHGLYESLRDAPAAAGAVPQRAAA